jgi:hypothetical protein
MCRAKLSYKQALEDTARAEEVLASHLVRLADEIERQGLPKVADLLQQSGQRYRASSITNRAVAASLKLDEGDAY